MSEAHQTLNARRMTQDDVEKVVAFSVAMARATEGLRLNRPIVAAGIKALVTNPELGFGVVAADKTGRIVGQMIVGGHEWSEWRNGMFWIITSFTFDPRRNGKLISELLINKIREFAWQESPKVIGLRAFILSENRIIREWAEAVGLCHNKYSVFERLLAPSV